MPVIIIIIIILIVVIIAAAIERAAFENKREARRRYYRDVYLKSDAWQRKRFVVLRRDRWKCVYCGEKATQVHHLRYARYNIGREPIDWLVSVCKTCHEAKHPK
jgi:5-methylcytosine-specific restriction endonuclease McrA